MESETLGKLGEALAKAQGAMDAAAKDSVNPHFRSKYADLASIREAIRVPLSVNGLAFFQRTTSTPEGVTVETTLLHSSGEFIRDSCWLPVAQQTAQAYGSALTYARRYSLSSLVGVVADNEDDDGNAGSAPRPQAKPAHQAAPKAQFQPQQAAAAPSKLDAEVKKFQAATAEVCAVQGHVWNLKGTCDGCGVAEKPPQPIELRARARRLWTKAHTSGITIEQFQAKAAVVLGKTASSTEWTEDDVGRLEVAFQEPEPGEAG